MPQVKFPKLIIALLFIISACEEKAEVLKNVGEITLSSEFHGADNFYYRFGYSFEKQDFFQIPLASKNDIPDIFLEDILLPGDKGLISFIYSEESNVNGILKTEDFESLTEAEAYYNNYIEAVNGSWKSYSDTLQSYQVYTFKTSENKYVKILIQDVRIVENISISDFVEVDLKYYIQRDGSGNFVD